MINCEWIRKQKKEQSAHGSSPGPKCKPNVRLRVRCANTQQPCFSALCDAWLLRKRDEIRESSYIKYRAILERHIKPRLGSRRLGGICTASVDAFTRELLETDGLSVKTVHDILSVLHSVLKDTEARRPTDALALQIRYPKGKRREMRVLTIEEQKRLVAYLLHPTDSCKFGLLLALYTGLRIGELCALRWSCIDLREQTIRIAATMQRLGGTGEGTRIVIGAPKSDSSLRTIPLPAQIAVLCRHMQPADPEAYVLTGGPAYMEPRTLQYRLKRYTAACGLKGVHAHTLRHTFATRAIESGFELKSLSEVLGHATTAITINNGDLQAAESLATTYSKILASNSILDAVLQELGPDVSLSRKSLSGMVSVSVITDTQLLEVVITSTDPAFACKVAGAFAKVAPTEIVRITKAGGVEIVDQPEIPTDKASPRTVFDTAIGVIIGVMVAAVIVILRTLADTTIYLPEDIENMVGITVLGQIPDINSADDNYAYWTVTEEGAAKNEKE